MILITGGSGFIGSNLACRLVDDPAVSHICIIDNLLSSEKVNIPRHPKVNFINGSIADDSLLSTLRDEFTHIFHLATYHGNQSSIHNPLADHENNLLTTLKLFEHVKYFKTLKSIVYAGAGCAVAEKTDGPPKATKEADTVSLSMDSPYSISKIAGEFYAKYYFKEHKLPVIRTRFQNVYGPREILGAGAWRGTPATIWRNVVPTFLYKAIHKEALPLENGGSATRDFIFVDDIVEGLIAAAKRGKPGDVYNLATGKEISILELASAINAATGNPTPPKSAPKRSWDHSGRRFGCPEKAKKELSFEARVPLEKGIALTLEWTLASLDLIEATIRKHSHHL